MAGSRAFSRACCDELATDATGNGSRDSFACRNLLSDNVTLGLRRLRYGLFTWPSPANLSLRVVFKLAAVTDDLGRSAELRGHRLISSSGCVDKDKSDSKGPRQACQEEAEENH
jgi:hypothetical protein